MSIVTYFKRKEKIILTLYRDETEVNSMTIHPKIYFKKRKKTFYPKDIKTGGTWFVIDEFGNAIVLLNDTLQKNNEKNGDRKSRGVVVIELIESEKILESWKILDLLHVEPFTLIVYTNKKLYKLQWNAISKSLIQLDENNSHVWTSNFINSNKINFHKFLKIKDSLKDLKLHDKFDFKIFNISQAEIINNKVNFKYWNLNTTEIIETNFIIL